MWKRVALLLLVTSTASADPTVRFGLTFGVDRNMPEAKQYGPLVAAGLHDQRFGAEVHYAYLSFMDPSTLIHRLGVALRGDIFREYVTRSCPAPSRSSCREARALFGELGAARRFGHWRATDLATHDTTAQTEASAALGYELGLPTRGAFQLSLRLSIARRDPELVTAIACRGCTSVPATMPTQVENPLAASVMLEWAWLFGRPR